MIDKLLESNTLVLSAFTFLSAVKAQRKTRKKLREPDTRIFRVQVMSEELAHVPMTD